MIKIIKSNLTLDQKNNLNLFDSKVKFLHEIKTKVKELLRN